MTVEELRELLADAADDDEVYVRGSTRHDEVEIYPLGAVTLVADLDTAEYTGWPLGSLVIAPDDHTRRDTWATNPNANYT